MKFQITNHKSQTNLKSKYPNSKHVWNLVFGVWNFRSLHANGYAALTTLILTLAVSLTVIGGFTFFSLKEVTVTRAYTRSLEARTIAESGIEDGVYRVITGKQLLASETLNVGSGSTTITLTISGNNRTIRSEGVRAANEHHLETHIAITTAQVNFFYGIQVSDGGLEMSNNAVVNGNVFSNGNIIGASGATITGDAIVAGGIPVNPEVQWTTHDANHAFATSNGNRDIAQSFIATTTGALSKISVYLGKTGNPSSNITLHIVADDSGEPDTSGIANTTITPSQVGGSPSWIDASFASPPTLTNGTKYWIVLDASTDSSSNYWNWRKDTTDAYASNTGKYTSNWSTGNPTWTNTGGDHAFRVWIGGTTNKIDGMVIGDASTGTGRANLFVNTKVHGSDCPNAYCIVENPSRLELPISEGVIQDWRDAAADGGTCALPTCDAAGNYKLTGGASGSLGPIKINGNLELDNGATLTVTGTIHVVGEIKLSNLCTVKLSPGYGVLSGAIITDSKVTISNNCAFQGSGQAGSYMLLLSAKNAPTETVIDISNNSLGVIYYAANGKMKFSNNAQAKEATGYGIELDNNAVITYESGLSSVNFSQGPGAGYDITYWREVE
ncbi:MAG: hypothetical protein A2847_00290 [Candidatus Sungbacteria bacterium RIFCSPHIGHO2_01_FULL_50_25]|uniref:Uncharacterized protein n=1 Tax=Candidatus Sungbacteria bacterium RIFCSPHIGHO2_01_FULL_50_25 TaxID=1802265 RepID=A0A1G2KAL9_9BACT|nr:MAG: hypothetical protein A2847_00290 [Candidatus Sungbacteria bacterium RIFCSPHIGHO2_01_FULL_50_25]